MKYKLKVLLVDGDTLYRPMYKKFLFWHSIPLIELGYGTIYGNTSYERAIEVINRHKKENHKYVVKHISNIPID